MLFLIYFTGFLNLHLHAQAHEKQRIKFGERHFGRMQWQWHQILRAIECRLILVLNNYKTRPIKAMNLFARNSMPPFIPSYSLCLSPPRLLPPCWLFLSKRLKRMKTCLHSCDDRIFNAVKLKYRQCNIFINFDAPSSRLHCTRQLQLCIRANRT